MSWTIFSSISTLLLYMNKKVQSDVRVHSALIYRLALLIATKNITTKMNLKATTTLTVRARCVSNSCRATAKVQTLCCVE